jgi:hypothetical protein
VAYGERRLGQREVRSDSPGCHLDKGSAIEAEDALCGLLLTGS